MVSPKRKGGAFPPRPCPRLPNQLGDDLVVAEKLRQGHSGDAFERDDLNRQSTAAAVGIDADHRGALRGQSPKPHFERLRQRLRQRASQLG